MSGSGEVAREADSLVMREDSDITARLRRRRRAGTAVANSTVYSTQTRACQSRHQCDSGNREQPLAESLRMSGHEPLNQAAGRLRAWMPTQPVTGGIAESRFSQPDLEWPAWHDHLHSDRQVPGHETASYRL